MVQGPIGFNTQGHIHLLFRFIFAKSMNRNGCIFWALNLAGYLSFVLSSLKVYNFGHRGITKGSLKGIISMRIAKLMGGVLCLS
jgi:hypothetical protein